MALRTGRPGYTLIEVMVVVVIMGILGGMAIPSMRKSISRSRSRSAVQIIVDELRKARSQAVKTNFPWGCYIDCTNNYCLIFQDNDRDTLYDAPGESIGYLSVRVIPGEASSSGGTTRRSYNAQLQYIVLEGAAYSSTGRYSIIFNPNGSANRAIIIQARGQVSARDTKYYISVMKGLGTARLLRWPPDLSGAGSVPYAAP